METLIKKSIVVFTLLRNIYMNLSSSRNATYKCYSLQRGLAFLLTIRTLRYVRIIPRYTRPSKQKLDHFFDTLPVNVVKRSRVKK